MIVEGQVHGAAAHGISAALFEHFGYGERGLGPRRGRARPMSLSELRFCW